MPLSFSKLMKTVSLALVFALALSSPALAKRDHEKSYDDKSRHRYEDSRHRVKNDDRHDRRSGKWESRDRLRHRDYDDRRPVIMSRFNDDHRKDIRIYIKDDYYRRCPPGLAKKHDGCIAPGRFKEKHYVIGQIIGYDYAPVPTMLARRLGPPPAGTFYAQVDSDVLLISEATKKVLDAVTLLSAMQ